MEEAPGASARGEQDYSIVDDRASPATDGRVARAALRPGRGRAAVRARRRAPSGELQADLVLLAMGFLHPEQDGCVDQLGVDQGRRAATSKAADLRRPRSPGVFAAGDARRGQSLIVWAINEGRQARGWSTATSHALDARRRASRCSPATSHDADEGPEGPPSHADGALTVERQA